MSGTIIVDGWAPCSKIILRRVIRQREHSGKLSRHEGFLHKNGPPQPHLTSHAKHGVGDSWMAAM